MLVSFLKPAAEGRAEYFGMGKNCSVSYARALPLHLAVLAAVMADISRQLAFANQEFALRGHSPTSPFSAPEMSAKLLLCSLSLPMINFTIF